MWRHLVLPEPIIGFDKARAPSLELQVLSSKSWPRRRPTDQRCRVRRPDASGFLTFRPERTTEPQSRPSTRSRELDQERLIDARGRKEPALLKQLQRVSQSSVNAPQQRDADEAPGQRQLKRSGGAAAPVVKAHIHPLKPPRPGRRPSRGSYDAGRRPP